MATKKSLFDAMELRRSIYALEASSPIPDESIQQIIEFAIKHVPSAFNVQSAKAVLLLGKHHQKLWDIAIDVAKSTFPPPVFDSQLPKLQGHKAAYGTVLWFEDQNRFVATEKQLGPQRWAGIKDKMPQWSEHSAGMHQYAVWLALEAEGFGANLQHNNPAIDQRVQQEWNIPVDWSLKAQLVFGKPVGPPRGKDFLPIEERVIVHKS